MQRIGTLNDIWRYPVKSMRGERVDDVFVAYTGLMGDRVYAVSSSTANPEFPWHTNREQEEFILYKARFTNRNRSLKPKDLEAALKERLNPPYPSTQDLAVEVELPIGQVLDINDPAFLDHLSDKSKGELKVHFTQKNMVDCRPLSLFSTQTLDQLNAETEMDLDKLRFRSNFYVDWDEAPGFYENQLVDKKLKIGEQLEIMVIELDPRCKTITIDPETSETSPKVLKTIVRNHEGFAGVFAAVIQEGVVKAGDEIYLME
mgnify:CR=1 FL=1